MNKINRLFVLLSFLTLANYSNAFCEFNGVGFNKETNKWEYHWCDPLTQKTFQKNVKGDFQIVKDYPVGFLAKQSKTDLEFAAGFKLTGTFTYQYNRAFGATAAATAGAVNATGNLSVSDQQTKSEQIEYSLGIKENYAIQSGDGKCGLGTAFLLAPIGNLTGIYCLKAEWTYYEGVWKWIRSAIGRLGGWEDGYIWQDASKTTWAWKNTFTPTGSVPKEVDYGFSFWKTYGNKKSVSLTSYVPNTEKKNTLAVSVVPDAFVSISDFNVKNNLTYNYSSLDYTVNGEPCSLSDIQITFANSGKNAVQEYSDGNQQAVYYKITEGMLGLKFDWGKRRYVNTYGYFMYKNRDTGKMTRFEIPEGTFESDKNIFAE